MLKYELDSKRYLKKYPDNTELTVVNRKPVYGKQPILYRDTSWNIDGIWYESTGDDLLNKIDPFSDGSLVGKWVFDGEIVDMVTGEVGRPTKEVNYVDGVFGKKALALHDGDTSNGSVLLKHIDRDFDAITIAGIVRLPMNLGGWIELWGLEADSGTDSNSSRTPSIFITQRADDISIEHIELQSNNTIAADTSTSSGAAMMGVPNTRQYVGVYMHVSQVVSKYKQKLYINGILVAEKISPDELLQDSGNFKLGSDYGYAKNADYQMVEMYNRELNNDEIITLVNQQTLNIVKYDGLFGNPKPFTYLEKAGKLLEMTVSKDGGLIRNEFVEPEDNFPIKRIVKRHMIYRDYFDGDYNNAVRVNLLSKILPAGKYEIMMTGASRKFTWDDPNSDNTDPAGGYAYFVIDNKFAHPTYNGLVPDNNDGFGQNAIILSETDDGNGGRRNFGYRQVTIDLEDSARLEVYAGCPVSGDNGIHMRTEIVIVKLEETYVRG